ncbi:hypothetical protein ML435_09220 [Staphylococcus roterodami]|nr:hypothetical protein ML435_09220 [Staphylococcus roterodami]
MFDFSTILLGRFVTGWWGHNIEKAVRDFLH